MAQKNGAKESGKIILTKNKLVAAIEKAEV